MSKQWAAKLDCGHYLKPIGRLDVERIRDMGGTAYCPHCEGVSTFTREFKRGGLNARQTMERLASLDAQRGFEQEHAEQDRINAERDLHLDVPKRHTNRADGLSYLTDEDGVTHWWCRYCEGLAPGLAAAHTAHDTETLGADWAWHTTSAQHTLTLTTIEQSSSTA